MHFDNVRDNSKFSLQLLNIKMFFQLLDKL